MYDPIYSQNIGLCGFRCRVVEKDGKSCTRVVRTYRGIIMHCLRVHGLRPQMCLPGMENNEKKTERSNAEPIPIGDTIHIKRPKRFATATRT